MKVLTFQTRLNADYTLTVPLGVAEQIQAEEAIRVVLFVSEAAEDEAWAALTAEQFLDGYSAGDAVYANCEQDSLPS